MGCIETGFLKIERLYNIDWMSFFKLKKNKRKFNCCKVINVVFEGVMVDAELKLHGKSAALFTMWKIFLSHNINLWI
jgi:hypothetical protein